MNLGILLDVYFHCKVRVPADEPEAVDLDPGVLARRLDAPATVKAVLAQGGRVLLRYCY